ncbi:alpha/beta hydrolase family protein [Sphingomonas hylomeconis]|uniref:Alpha/beta hydrolase n=1 Tax=Sphingomonas hylomeconis TaxID=1395958 RepID=A0ABV7SVR2_9SPHN|nr:hypothetical protein [Sphingomonas hylomeconis]
MTPSTYRWSGGSEAMLRFGPTTGPVVIAAMPLFEEANRTRSFIVAILRALAERGIGSALPDLPGTGDSLTETEHATLSNWQEAFSGCAMTLGRDRIHAFGVRGGTLLDATAAIASRYHFAPIDGNAVVRDLLRTRLAAAKEDGVPADAGTIAPPGPPITLAGNRISRQLLADLTVAAPSTVGPCRIARLDSDGRPGDVKFPGAPLWRRAEPGNDPALAVLIADDIAASIATCAA